MLISSRGTIEGSGKKLADPCCNWTDILSGLWAKMRVFEFVIDSAWSYRFATLLIKCTLKNKAVLGSAAQCRGDHEIDTRV